MQPRVRLFLFSLLFAPSLSAQRSGTPPALSAPVSDVQYTIRFDRSSAARRLLHVKMEFATTGSAREPVLLSLPAWTPGAYEISNFARWVRDFDASAGGTPLRWDKWDYDTWRIFPNGAGRVTVRFSYMADSLDNAMAWSRDDFVFFNGTNVFLYPEGRGSYEAAVTVESEPDWQVVTGMASGARPRTYRAGNYHDLVDMPFFVGKLDLDSAQVEGKWVRLATYPTGQLAGESRRQFWEQVQRMIAPMTRVFGELPYEHYSILIVFDSAYAGASALEHQNSHVGIYTPFIIGNPVFPSITAHEIVHLWNVKRMRPAELVPYVYDRPQPTPWLWVSEGITDYYADLSLVRSGIVDSSAFLQLTSRKIAEVSSLPPVALEDASLSTWIAPRDGTHYSYYDKGSLAGLLLDILIRDASDNQRSLDDVMREVYWSTYKRGRGFTFEDWWGAVSRAAGRAFSDFHDRYVDGREPYPWATVLPLAGLRLRVDSIREPRLGVYTTFDSSGVRITGLEPDGAAAAAGVRVGDLLVQVGEIPVSDVNFGVRFRSLYSQRQGDTIDVVVRRGSQTIRIPMVVRVVVRTQESVQFDRSASPKALRVRRGLLTGTTDGRS
jgi:predicted metalloprotease with PDZ domain